MVHDEYLYTEVLYYGSIFELNWPNLETSTPRLSWLEFSMEM